MTKQKQEPRWIGLGSVSTATLRTQDLIANFEDALQDSNVTVKRPAAVNRYVRDRKVRNGDEQEASYYLDELTEKLEELAPPYVYFGSHEGDGADFGYWVSFDSLEEDKDSGELPHGDQLPDSAEDGSLFLHVSDHGNLELYQYKAAHDGHPAEWVSLWSVV